MQITLHRVVWVAGALAAAALTPAARAQAPGRSYLRAPAPYNPNRAAPVVFVRVPVITNIAVQTTVSVPDGGTVTVGGTSQIAEGRNEYGVPVLGKVPYAGRGFRNISYGRTTVIRRVNASGRIIDLREEEYRQTGYRSP